MSEKKSSTALKEIPQDDRKIRDNSSWGSRTNVKQAFGAQNSGSPRRREPDPHGESWWESFFDLTYARVDFDSIGIEQTGKEVNLLIDKLDVTYQSRILDIGSGLGRHALEFARRGFQHITGLDQCSIFIEESRARAQLEDLNVRFINADARAIPFREEFDAAYIWMNLIGYFDDRDDDQRVFASASRALKPGGKLLIDIMNRDYLICNFSPRSWKSRYREYVLEERRFDLRTSTVYSTWRMFTRTGTFKKEMKLRLYSLHELIRLLERSGLGYQAVWGCLDAEPVSTKSYHLKILAVKE